MKQLKKQIQEIGGSTYNWDEWAKIAPREFKKFRFPTSYQEFFYANPCLFIFAIGMVAYIIATILN